MKNYDTILDVIGPTKNAVEGVEAIMKAFSVDKKTAEELLDKAIDYINNFQY